MTKKVLLLTLILFFTIQSSISAELQGEVFHIEKGKVVRSITIDEILSREVGDILETISGIFTGFEPIPKEGYMIKVPLDPAVEIKNEWLHDFISEVIFIIPKEESPYLLLFDNETNPFFFTFEQSLDKFLAKIKMEK